MCYNDVKNVVILQLREPFFYFVQTPKPTNPLFNIDL